MLLFSMTEIVFNPVILIYVNTVGYIDKPELASFQSHTICYCTHILCQYTCACIHACACHKTSFLAALLIKQNI